MARVASSSHITSLPLFLVFVLSSLPITMMKTTADRLTSSFSGVSSASSWFEVYAAFSTFLMLLRTAVNDLIPPQLRSFILSKLRTLISHHQPNQSVTLHVSPHWDDCCNILYYAVREYLPGRITHTYKSLKIGKIEHQKKISFAIDNSQQVIDEFEGMKLTWKHVENTEKNSPNHKGFQSISISYNLTFHEKHRDKVMSEYIPHILNAHEAMKAEQKIVKLYSMGSCGRLWTPSNLTHPSTFDTIALDPELKKKILDDLERFLRRKALYKRVGKPWKRGYLLYGPPGTGKSSLIAAMANYLKFDVYDLELSRVSSNDALLRAMRNTSNRSIIVIEDIDCNKEVHARPTIKEYESDSDYDSDSSSDFESKLKKATLGGLVRERFTLSGLLNYMDGLWSSCGEERIIVFTTNHVERIDPALLRPGRMDMHIELSFCRGTAFRILAWNYWEIKEEHPLFKEIDLLLERTDVTPAVVAEQLLRNENSDLALEGLVQFLKEKDNEGEAGKKEGEGDDK